MPTDYAAFLGRTLPTQTSRIASHRFDGERVWLKKAGPPHGRWRYQLQAVGAALLRFDLMAPIPNPGGEAAIAVEGARLDRLATAGLRVPALLAQQADGLLLSDLGESASASSQTPLLAQLQQAERAAGAGPANVLALWHEGLAAIADVHARGHYLSQAFARNMICCPDGAIGFVDFEDDPAATLSFAQCRARDWLNYLHSTAALIDACDPQAAAERWHTALAAADAGVAPLLATTARRMGWLRHLPADRRWGRDTQQVRAAARLLTRWYSG